VADMPSPRLDSEQQECVGCREMIWVAIKSPVEPPKICIQCVEDGQPVV